MNGPDGVGAAAESSMASDTTQYECDFATWSGQSLGKPVTLLYRHYCTYLDHELAPYGLTAAHVPLLGHLWAGGVGETQNQIARELGVDKATVSRCAAYLVKAGLVTQSVSEKDSRAFTLGLTDAGRDLCPPVGVVLRKWTATITDGMSPDEVDTVIRVLSDMIRRGGRLVADSGSPSSNHDSTP